MGDKKGKKARRESEGTKTKGAGGWTTSFKIILIASIALWILAGYYWVLYISNAAFGTTYGDALLFTTLTSNLALMWAMMFTIPAFILLVLAIMRPGAKGKK
jgi:hypothetical protein